MHGALATPQAAEAKIVYTQTNEAINFGARTTLDLNNDGILDFNFAEGGLGHFINDWVHPLNSNHVVGASGGYWASAMPAGAIIGPGAKFVGHIALMQQLFTNSFGTKYNGPWVHATNRFLGLEVTINGQKHLTTLSGWRQLQGIHLTCPHHPESCSDLSQSSWEFSH